MKGHSFSTVEVIVEDYERGHGAIERWKDSLREQGRKDVLKEIVARIGDNS